MTDVISILEDATQWVTESVTEPSILSGQIHSINLMGRGIVCDIINSDDELIGVVDRSAYSIDSHEIWSCAIVSSTSLADLDAMVGVVKRIIAEFERTSTENHLEWHGGDYKRFNNVRHEFHWAIIRKKSMIQEW